MECHQCGFLPIAGIIHGSQLQPGREWRATLRLFQVDWKSKQSREGRIPTEKKQALTFAHSQSHTQLVLEFKSVWLAKQNTQAKLKTLEIYILISN